MGVKKKKINVHHIHYSDPAPRHTHLDLYIWEFTFPLKTFFFLELQQIAEY